MQTKERVNKSRNNVNKMKKEKKKKKKKESEDWCFVCKDGGVLIVCDFPTCEKVYHSDCINLGDTCDKEWKCDRHSCHDCGGTPKFYCYCCPVAICQKCIEDAEFGSVRGKYGFCTECLDLVMRLEEKDLKTDEGEIDIKDRDTFECLFSEYWEIIKEEQNLCLEDVYAADETLMKGPDLSKSSKKSRIDKDEEDPMVVSSDSDLEDIEIDNNKGKRKKSIVVGSDSDLDDRELNNKKRKKKKSAVEGSVSELVYRVLNDKRRKRKKSMVLEFVGWGSKPLVEFLTCLGKNTANELSEYEVEDIILDYVKDKKLFDPSKKRKILCDDKLKSIFKRDSIMKHRIHAHLEGHFARTTDSECSEEEENEDEFERSWSYMNEGHVKPKKQRKVEHDMKSINIRTDPKFQVTSFASIVADNVKLIYLRRSLIEELSNESLNFESKVMGTFVKVKRGPASSDELSLVIGIRQASNEVNLRVSGLSTDALISSSMLSDMDISVEDIDDLTQRVDKGIVSKLTVADLENKLIYMKRSLIEELPNDPLNFESKVVGSFVKVKRGPASHELSLVTGINQDSSEVILRVSGLTTDTSISMLSDMDISEEDINDLSQRVVQGIVPKLTVADLENKAKSLHADITKHWIKKELARLEQQIEFTHEKGRRREMYEYLDKRDRLKKPAEQERLLQQLPKVIPEIVKYTEADFADLLETKSKRNESSPKSILVET